MFIVESFDNAVIDDIVIGFDKSSCNKFLKDLSLFYLSKTCAIRAATRCNSTKMKRTRTKSLHTLHKKRSPHTHTRTRTRMPLTFRSFRQKCYHKLVDSCRMYCVWAIHCHCLYACMCVVSAECWVCVWQSLCMVILA